MSRIRRCRDTSPCVGRERWIRMDAVLEKLMKVADKELRRARRKHPQFVDGAGFREKDWDGVLSRFRKRFPEPAHADVVLEEECLEFLADIASGRDDAALTEAGQVVAVLVRILSETGCR